ncbi:MAG: hypothetical protein KKD01_19485 [Proteobacteria bacterium]|nr:hypothetical protein [Pseudomonadota bacterium]
MAEENLEPIEDPIDTPPVDDQKPDEDPLAKLEQKTKSWLGRQEKDIKDIKEMISSLSESMTREPVYQPAPKQDELASLNEKWQNEILSGNVINVLDEYSNLNNQAQTTLRNQNLAKVDNFVAALKDDPLFDKIRDSASKVAKQLVLEGTHTPAQAVREAYQTAKIRELEGTLTQVSTMHPGSLETLRAGQGKPKATMPKRFDSKVEARIEQDIADGVFKNRQEWIDAANPRLRKSLGID